MNAKEKHELYLRLTAEADKLTAQAEKSSRWFWNDTKNLIRLAKAQGFLLAARMVLLYEPKEARE